MKVRNKIIAAAGVAALVTMAGIGGAVASGQINGHSITDHTIAADKLTAHAVTVLKGNRGPAGAKGAKGATGAQGPAGPAGPAGTNGSDGTLTVSAATHLTNRSDSATDGSTWAKDDFIRTATLTRQHAVPAAKCSATATACWFYTESNADSGTFTTVAGANSPQHQVPISGVVMGSMNGVNHLEFYADSATPDVSLVPATINGDTAASSGDWPAKFFPAGTTVTDANQIGWSWTYAAANTCESWTNAIGGNSGDITGVNACS